MCNLYSLTKGQAAIRDLFLARYDRTGNLPLFPGIFPDQMAPIVRTGAGGERELVMARWGMPGPPQFGGAHVWANKTVASFRQRRFANTRTPSLARRRSGSR
jgi:putative SOS response-associated peptidase YedK